MDITTKLLIVSFAINLFLTGLVVGLRFANKALFAITEAKKEARKIAEEQRKAPLRFRRKIERSKEAHT